MPVPEATCNLSKWGFAFKFNALGYRGPVFEKHKQPGTIRIVCMGDSVTMGWRVEEEKTFCYTLQHMLAPEFKKKVETINAGVMAYTSFQGLHQLQTRILDLRPDLIIISYNWDDHSPATTTQQVFGSNSSKKLQIMPDKEIPNLSGKSGPLDALSALRTFQLVQFAVSKALPADAEKLQIARHHETMEGIVRVPLPDYRNNLERMIEIAKANNIIPVLLTEVSGAESHGKLSGDAVVQAQPIFNGQYNTAMKEIAAGHGVLCVDTIGVFQEKDPWFFDSIHPRSRGHLLIASQLASAILSHYRSELSR